MKTEATMKIYRIPLDNGEKVPMPEFASSGAACFDLYSANTHSIFVAPQSISKVPLGIKVEVPKGWELKLYSRSGLSYKGILSVAQGTGHIDSDYRGEICALVNNTTNSWYEVKPFSRICQGALSKLHSYKFQEVTTEDELSTTDRGEGGFGSTGLTNKEDTNNEK